MPLILRRFQTIPLMQPDGSMADKEYATVAFVDANGQQYSQINVHAEEVSGINENDAMMLRSHDDIDWSQLAHSIFEYASEWKDGKRGWDDDEVNQIIMSAFWRPLEAVKAEPHGVAVPAMHDEMIGVGKVEV